ncbi:MAG: 30S ribosomal protein S2, partial [Planctomycetota bacterium]
MELLPVLAAAASAWLLGGIPFGLVLVRLFRGIAIRTVGSGKDVLFVGTKRQGAEAVAREAARCGMPYVSDRWLGGTLTNFRTIRNRLARLEELEALIPGEKCTTYSKKMQSSLRREFRKMLRNLGGIRTLSRLPEC